MKREGASELAIFGLVVLAVWVVPALFSDDSFDTRVEESVSDLTEIREVRAEENAYQNQYRSTSMPATKTQECHPSYSGCLNPYASDYDCVSGSGNGPYYTGRVQVYGYDEFDLDRDNDGWGCE